MFLMLDLEGLEVTSEETKLLQHPYVGGVILFTRNYESPEQLQHLIKQIRAATKHRLLIAVDHEGGRVQRFRFGFTNLPALGTIGKIYINGDTTQALALAKQAGWIMASELVAMDIDFSFAPVLDLDKGISEIIGNRSFHHDPVIVITLAQAYISGMHEAGMGAVGKHFPGHGGVAPDSHIELPIDPRPYNTILAEDIAPFMGLIDSSIEGIMPAHVVYSASDSLPAGFSTFWLQTILRKQLGFKGVIFSDDLSMTGATHFGDTATCAELALKAGCDMILVCNNRASVYSLLEKPLKPLSAKVSAQRLTKLFARNSLSWDALHQSHQWQVANKLLSTII